VRAMRQASCREAISHCPGHIPGGISRAVLRTSAHEGTAGELCQRISEAPGAPPGENGWETPGPKVRLFFQAKMPLSSRGVLTLMNEEGTCTMRIVF